MNKPLTDNERTRLEAIMRRDKYMAHFFVGWMCGDPKASKTIRKFIAYHEREQKEKEAVVA